MVCLPMPGKRGSVTRALKRRRPRGDRGAGVEPRVSGEGTIHGDRIGRDGSASAPLTACHNWGMPSSRTSLPDLSAFNERMGPLIG